MNEFIKIGQIGSTHGYKGEVKVLPLTDFPERFQLLHTVKVARESQIVDLKVDSVKAYQNQYLFKFAEINSKEEAAEYRGAFLMVREDEAYPLPEGSYYHYQLLGMQVFDLERGKLGELKEIITTGANDVYVIRGGKYGEVLIPAIKEVILQVDTGNNKMQVKLLPGLIDQE